MSDQHALNYYAAPGRETATQAGPVQNWQISADTISGPVGQDFSGGSNQCDFAGLSEMTPSDVVNSGRGPIDPASTSDMGIIPTV
jgi:hypothetical protein